MSDHPTPILCDCGHNIDNHGAADALIGCTCLICWCKRQPSDIARALLDQRQQGATINATRAIKAEAQLTAEPTPEEVEAAWEYLVQNYDEHVPDNVIAGVLRAARQARR